MGGWVGARRERLFSLHSSMPNVKNSKKSNSSLTPLSDDGKAVATSYRSGPSTVNRLACAACDRISLAIARSCARSTETERGASP